MKLRSLLIACLILVIAVATPVLAQKAMKLDKPLINSSQPRQNESVNDDKYSKRVDPVNNTYKQFFIYSYPSSKYQKYNQAARRISFRIDPTQLEDKTQPERNAEFIRRINAAINDPEENRIAYGIQYATFVKVIADNFTFVAVPSADISLVNQLQVDVTEPNITVGGLLTDFRTKKQKRNPEQATLPMFRLGGLVKAGYSEGLGALFSDNKLNPGITASAQLHLDLIALLHNVFRQSKNSSYPYILDVDDYLEFANRQDSLNFFQGNEKADLVMKQMQSRFGQDFVESRKKLALDDTIAANTARKNYATSRLSELGTAPPIDSLKKYNKQLSEAEFKLEEALLKREESASASAKLAQEDFETTYKLKNLDPLQDKRQTSVMRQTRWTRQVYFWLTGEGDWSSKKYFLFNNMAPFSSQVTEKPFTGKRLGVRLNWLRLNRKAWFDNRYISVGIARTFTNNIALLDVSDATRSEKYAILDTTRQVATKTSVYPFSKYIEGWGTELNAQVIQYLTPQRSFAIDLLAQRVKLDQTETNKDSQSRINFGVGLIFLAENKKQTQAKVNIELLFRFNDLNNVQKSPTQEWYRRTDIGLKVGLPFGLPR